MGEKKADSVDEAEPKTTDVPKDRSDEVALSDAADRDDDEPESGGRRSRVLRLARRLMDTREFTNDTREIIGTVIGASDRAKTEAVRMAAREVRNYLDALKLKDDLLDLMTSYSLEVSISLKPLADAVRKTESESDESPLPNDEA